MSSAGLEALSTALAALPVALRRRLLNEYQSLKSAYLAEQFDSCGVRAGRFVGCRLRRGSACGGAGSWEVRGVFSAGCPPRKRLSSSSPPIPVRRRRRGFSSAARTPRPSLFCGGTSSPTETTHVLTPATP